MYIVYDRSSQYRLRIRHSPREGIRVSSWLFSFHSQRHESITRFWFNAGFTIKPRLIKPKCTHLPRIYERMHTRCASNFPLSRSLPLDGDISVTLSLSLSLSLSLVPLIRFSLFPSFFTLAALTLRREFYRVRGCKVAISRSVEHSAAYVLFARCFYRVRRWRSIDETSLWGNGEIRTVPERTGNSSTTTSIHDGKLPEMKDFYHSSPSSSDRNSYGIFEKIVSACCFVKRKSWFMCSAVFL